MAEVFCVDFADGRLCGKGQTNAAMGTTDWSLDLVSQPGVAEPGIYQLTAFAQDGAGNLSASATEYFTNLAQLTIITNVNGQLTTNAAQYLVPGRQYSVVAAPGPGQQFDTWTSNGVVSLDPVQTFTGRNQPHACGTFVSNTLPAGGSGHNESCRRFPVQTTNAGLTINWNSSVNSR